MLLGIGIVLAVVGIIIVIWGFMEESAMIKIVGVIFIIAAIVCTVFHFSTESGQRMLKTISSDVTGGIERTVEVYDQQGNLIKTYEGKLDVETNDYGNKVLFDLDGKRTIIYNATVIVQER